MKNLRSLCATFVLTLLLSVSALAGHIETPVAQPQPPSTSAAETTNMGSNSTDGYIETGVTGSDPLTEAAVSLVTSVFALL